MDKHSEWVYYHYPKPTPISCYYTEIKKYVDWVSGFDDVMAIYSMGSIKCPGISDIDLIVVTKDIVHNPQQLSVAQKKYDNNLFIHDVIVISHRIFKYLQYIFFASNLKLIWACPTRTYQTVDNVPERERALSILLDFTESRLLEFQMLFKSRRVNVRQWLTRIESLRHTVRLASKIIGEDIRDKYAQVLNNLSGLRETWLNEERLELDLFKILLQETANAFGSILKDLSDIPELSISSPNDRRRIVIHNKVIAFSSKVSYRAVIKEIAVPLKNNRQYLFVELPYYYLTHLAGYFDKEITGCYLKPLEKVKQNLPNSRYVNFQSKRLHAIHNHWQFLRKNKIHYGMAGYICFMPKYHLRRPVRLIDYLIVRAISHIQN